MSPTVEEIAFSKKRLIFGKELWYVQHNFANYSIILNQSYFTFTLVTEVDSTVLMLKKIRFRKMKLKLK